MVVVEHQTVGGTISTMDTDLTVGSFMGNLHIIEWIDQIDKDLVVTLQDLSGVAKMYRRHYRRANTDNACKLTCWNQEGYPSYHQEYDSIKNKIATYKNIGAGI